MLAAELELEGLKTTGEPALVLEGVWLGDNGVDTWSVSDTGTLVYVAGTEDPYSTRLAWVDHRGDVEEIVDSGTAFLSPRVSPDGRYLLVQYEGTRIGLFDVRARVWSRLTGGAGSERWAAWHPDGETVIFNSDRESRGTVNLYRVKIGGGTPERLARSEYNQEPHFVSKDGKYLFYTEAPVPETGYDIWTLRLDLEEPPTTLLTTRANTFHPVLSPDLHWLAYVSDEPGRAEVYVQSFPEMNRQVRVSSAGGVDPLWSPDGRTLYFRSTNGRDAYRVSFEAGAGPTVSVPQFPFSGPFVEPNTYGRTWDISPDGQRFLVLKVVNPINQNELKVILNWNREVAEKIDGLRR